MTVTAHVRPASSALPGGWLLAEVVAEAGTVTVDTTAEGASRVVVCDTGGAGTAPPACSSVVLEADGGLRLSCRIAPPALWLSGGTVRIAPQVPTDTEHLALAAGDLLVLCSSEVLENLPHGLPHVVEPAAALPDPVARLQSVAADLRAVTTAGAAVVLTWAPPDD